MKVRCRWKPWSQPSSSVWLEENITVKVLGSLWLFGSYLHDFTKTLNSHLVSNVADCWDLWKDVKKSISVSWTNSTSGFDCVRGENNMNRCRANTNDSISGITGYLKMSLLCRVWMYFPRTTWQLVSVTSAVIFCSSRFYFWHSVTYCMCGVLVAMATVHLFLRNISQYKSLQPLSLLYFSREPNTVKPWNESFACWTTCVPCCYAVTSDALSLCFVSTCIHATHIWLPSLSVLIEIFGVHYSFFTRFSKVERSPFFLLSNRSKL